LQEAFPVSLAAVLGPIVAADLHDEAFVDDPFPGWERLRHDQPLFRDDVADRWLLTRHDDVAAVLRDHETYSTRPYLRIFTDVIGPTMVQMDGADHDVRRAIVAPALVGMRLQRNYLPLVEEVVALLFDRLPDAGPIDLVAGVTGPLPLRVVAAMLGMDADDDGYLREVTDRVIAALVGEEPARSVGIEAHEELSRRIDGMIDARVERPSSSAGSARTSRASASGGQYLSWTIAFTYGGR